MSEVQNIKLQRELVSRVTKSLKILLPIIEQENYCLENNQLEQLDQIIEDKQEALIEFNKTSETMQRFIFNNENDINKESAEIKQLRTLLVKLNELNEENMILVRVRNEISEIVMDVYKKSAMETEMRKLHYNEKGQVDPSRINWGEYKIKLSNKV